MGLDLTILSVALPTLATALQASTSDLQWFISIYNLVLAAMLLPAGLLGDRFGTKRLLIGALALFGLASLACAYAASAGQMIAARAALGLAAAFMMPLSTAIMTALFPPQERQKAIGMTVLANTIGIPLGPIIGGLLLNHFWWGSVFLINVPIVVAALLAGIVLIPRLGTSKRTPIDVRGIATSSVGLAMVTYGFIAAGDRGWTDAWTIACIVGGAIAVGVFWHSQRQRDRRARGSALIDTSLFSSRAYTWGAILATLMSFAMFGVLFTMPQLFQAVYSVDALGTGLRLLPIIGGLMVGAQLSERLMHKMGIKSIVAFGFLVMAVGLLAAATTTLHTAYAVVGAALAVIGLGIGFVLPGAMGAALAVLRPERSGVGSAAVHSLRFVGGGIGVAVLGTIISSIYQARLEVVAMPAAALASAKESVAAGVAIAQSLQSATAVQAVQSSFIHAMDVMLGVCGMLCVVGAVLALVFLPRRVQVMSAEQEGA